MYVLKDNIDMAGIYDVITRGTAEIYHQEDQNIFLKDLRSGAYMLSVNDPEKGIRWLQERENARYDLRNYGRRNVRNTAGKDIIWTP